MDAPTAANIRLWSQVDFDDLGFEIDTEPNPDYDPLERVVTWGSLWLQARTGRAFDDLDESSTDLAELKLVSGMERASMMLAEYTANVSQPEMSETASDFNMIQSFSAGSYSEVRRAPNSRTRGIHPWPDLADLLYDLMTDAIRASFSDVPQVGAVEPDWNVGIEIINAKRGQVITPFGPYMAPWDFPW